MTDNCRKHGFRGKRAALLALLAALTISQFRTVKAQNELSAVQERDLDSILVVGLRTGTDDYEETYVDLSDGRFLIAPTKNDKPFHVMGFRQDEIEIKLKNAEARPNGVSHILYRFFDSEISLYRALLLEEVDLAQLSSENLVKEFERSSETFQIFPRKKPPHVLKMIVYNLRHPVLKQPAVRQAISHAIPVKNQIINKVLFNKGESARGGVFESDSPLRPDGVNDYGYNRRKAVDLLTGEGWKDVNRDGTLEKGGREFSLNLVYRQGIENEERIARRIALACKRIGIEVIPEKKTVRELKKALFDGDYEMALFEHQFEENRQSLFDFFGNPETSYIKFEDQRFLRLNTRAEETEGSGQTLQLIRSMQGVLNEKCVVSFLFFEWYDSIIINGAKFRAIDPVTGELLPLDAWRFRK